MTEDPLEIINDEARAVAISHGAVWCDDADALLKRRIMKRLGGVQLYVPRQSLTERIDRNQAIRSRFDGRNIRELALEFQTSERTIRRIVDKTAHAKDTCRKLSDAA